MKKLLLLLTGLCAGLSANIGPEGFQPFLNEYFVETGTMGGDAIAKALKDGFPKARSIEIDRGNFVFCRLRFRDNPNVRIYQGDSSKKLWDMIADIKKPITFWLDAHTYPPKPNGEKNSPLIDELTQIKKHPIKTHTILIDDMHCVGTAAFDFLTKEDIKEKLWEINPDYEISYVPGGDDGEFPENVMVAKVPR